MRAENFLDVDHLASWLAMGGAVENMVLAAAAMGLHAQVELLPPSDDGRVCELVFRSDLPPDVDHRLADQIDRRATNRRLGRREKLPEPTLDVFREAARAHGASLQLITEEDDLRAIGAVIGGCDRVRFWNEHTHRELMEEVRWTRDEAERTRDGVDVRTLDIGSLQLAVLRLLASWNVVSAMRGLNLRQPFEAISGQAVRRSSAVGVLTVDGTGPHDYFRGGRAFERVWLAATELEIGLQPLAVAPFLFARLRRDVGPAQRAVGAARGLRATRRRLARPCRGDDVPARGRPTPVHPIVAPFGGGGARDRVASGAMHPVVLVTGDSDGLGNAAARALLRRRPAVTVVGLSRRADDAVVGWAELAPRDRERYRRYRVDLADEAAVDRAIDEVLQDVRAAKSTIRAVVLANGTGWLDSELERNPSLPPLMQRLNVATPVQLTTRLGEERGRAVDAEARLLYYSGLVTHPSVIDPLLTHHAALKHEAVEALRQIWGERVTSVMPGRTAPRCSTRRSASPTRCSSGSHCRRPTPTRAGGCPKRWRRSRRAGARGCHPS